MGQAPGGWQQGEDAQVVRSDAGEKQQSDPEDPALHEGSKPWCPTGERPPGLAVTGEEEMGSVQRQAQRRGRTQRKGKTKRLKGQGGVDTNEEVGEAGNEV